MLKEAHRIHGKRASQVLTEDSRECRRHCEEINGSDLFNVVLQKSPPCLPFVYNEGLEIRIYDTADPGTILQTSLYGETSRDYRINGVEELYITNFKTNKQPAVYVVEIWKLSESFLIASFTFETVK